MTWRLHCSISVQRIHFFLSEIGSPTALANQEIEDKLRKAAQHNGLYIPNGALWGGENIRRMADRGILQVP